MHGPGSLPAADGATAVLHATDSATDVVNGGYYEGLLPAEPAPQALDDKTSVRLWLATARLLGWDFIAARVPAAPKV